MSEIDYKKKREIRKINGRDKIEKEERKRWVRDMREKIEKEEIKR